VLLLLLLLLLLLTAARTGRAAGRAPVGVGRPVNYTLCVVFCILYTLYYILYTVYYNYIYICIYLHSEVSAQPTSEERVVFGSTNNLVSVYIASRYVVGPRKTHVERRLFTWFFSPGRFVHWSE